MNGCRYYPAQHYCRMPYIRPEHHSDAHRGGANHPARREFLSFDGWDHQIVEVIAVILEAAWKQGDQWH